MDWASLYPAYAMNNAEEKGTDDELLEREQGSCTRALSKPVEVADIGCGFGGLLFALAPKLPNTLLLGKL